MTKTLTQILDEHASRAETVGGWVWDAREIVRKRLQPGPSEDRQLFDLLQKIKYGLGGDPIDVDARPIADRLDRLERAARAVEEWWITDGMNHFDGAPAAIFALREALK